MGYVKKLEILLSFFLRQDKPGYSTEEKCLLKGWVHAFGQKFQILHLYICGKVGREYAFHDILERQNAFQTTKRKS